MRSDYRYGIHLTALVESLSPSIRKTEIRELCLYWLSVGCSRGDDGSARYNIRNQIDPAFGTGYPRVGKRTVQAGKLELAGSVMGVGA